jgi:hypothetical protein
LDIIPKIFGPSIAKKKLIGIFKRFFFILTLNLMKLQILIIALFFPFLLYAQSALLTPPMKWGEVSPDEWKLEKTNYSAGVMFQQRRTNQTIPFPI